MEQRDADVCVVGAGFAGLAAARSLAAKGKRVVVLEARDRVGGRTWNRQMDDGTIVSVGGTWLGVGQDRMFRLCADLGVATYPQYDEGAAILGVGGELHRYRGAAPRAHIVGLLSYAVALKRLSRLAARLPLDAPWDGPRAIELDAQTLAGWIRSRRNVPSAVGRELVEMAMQVLFCVDTSELSVLGALLLARGGGKRGFGYYTESKLTETHLIEGGPQLLAERIAAALGDSMVLDAPVRSISQTDAGVEIVADRCRVAASHVIVAVPPVTTASMRFDPALPADQMHLLNRMTSGAAIRVITTYDTPFWRTDGLAGISTVAGSHVVITIDQTPVSGTPGVLSSYAFGPGALEMARLEPEARRHAWLSELGKRFGRQAAAPTGYLETDWSAEQWSLGGMIGHMPPGALTSYGPALRRPTGRVHWAGSERATEMHGLMEGAVRSGERAAAEVLAAS